MAFLVTHPDEDGLWRGHFSFRASEAAPDQPEIRTTTLFVEASEPDVDARARGLGRPLLLALLESALDVYERRRLQREDPRRWFREHLAEHAARLAPDLGATSLSQARLSSLYESYRLDQAAHLIALIEAERFRELVERLLEGRTIDFRARDRFQLAMLVVQELERHLPLPPFERWVEDYLAHPEAYQDYTRALHRGGELP
jgi:hypothetical protein